MSSIGARAERVGDLKTKQYSEKDPALYLHRLLLDAGLPVAEIVSQEATGNGIITKTTEWVEGVTFDVLWKENKLASKHWEAFGEFFAKMNNLGVSSWDLVYRNILVRDDGPVVLCDLAKLYTTDFPEEQVVRNILNNHYYAEEWKNAFLDGYRKHRPISMDRLLEREIAINYNGYQDLYLNGKMIRKGVRSNRRLGMLKDDFGGKDVLDIGCSSTGMIARHVASNGAHAVHAVDNVVRTKTCNMIDLAAFLAYLEGLNIMFAPMDCEHIDFNARMSPVKWDFIFFCAMLGHLKGNREAYVKWLASITKVLYFETNMGGNKIQAELFLDKIGFKHIKCLGQSGDLDRDPNSSYVLYRCETERSK